MKKFIGKNKILFLGILLAAAVVFAMPVRTAIAYFSDYQKAAGESVIHLKWDTQIEEEMERNNKHVTISNTGEANAVVRVQIFAADFAETTPGESWVKGTDGWWYYREVLAPGDKTSELVVLVEGEDIPEEEFQIIVVHESDRAVYENDGTLRIPDNWGVPTPWISEQA